MNWCRRNSYLLAYIAFVVTVMAICQIAQALNG